MTEPTPNNQEQSPDKLLIDEPTNFQFHAAYVVYSELFDSSNNPEVKKELNQNIEDLKNEEISLEDFYANINRFRKDVPSHRHDRYSVTTQRKRDWRMKSQKQDRIRRHKK